MEYNLEDEPKFIKWKTATEKAGCVVHSVRSLRTVRTKNGSLLFALLDVDVESDEGTRLPNILFLRGDACVIVTLLHNEETEEERFLMVKQRRIGNGQVSLEFPAGMLDNETFDPLGVAIRELEEETGLAPGPDALFPLTRKPLYSSAGASDEGIHYFGCIVHLGNKQYHSFTERIGGNPDENEHIAVTLVGRKEAEEQTTSLQVRLGFYLFDEYMKNSDRQIRIIHV